MVGKDFDVAKNIKMTENLQCQMLAVLSDFFTAMQQNAPKVEKTEILARMEVLLYLMAARLGISRAAMDRKAVAWLRQISNWGFWRKNRANGKARCSNCCMSWNKLDNGG